MCQKVNPVPLLALSTQAEDFNAKRRTAFVIICSEDVAEGVYQGGFEIGMICFGTQWDRQPV